MLSVWNTSIVQEEAKLWNLVSGDLLQEDDSWREEFGVQIEELPATMYFQSHNWKLNWCWRIRWGNECNSSPHKISEQLFLEWDSGRKMYLIIQEKGLCTNHCSNVVWQNNNLSRSVVKTCILSGCNFDSRGCSKGLGCSHVLAVSWGDLLDWLNMNLWHN